MSKFDISKYEFDKEHSYLEIGGEAMIFHCHHYITNILRTILDADYVESDKFLIGSSVHSVHNQLTNLTEGLSVDESKRVAEDVYKAFGYGLINLSSMDENGIELKSSKSFFSKTWTMKFGKASKPVDFYTTGYIIAAYSVIYNIPLEEINGVQTTCMAVGDDVNTHTISKGECNFSIYPEKSPVSFVDEPKQPIGWEFEETVTNTFLGAHETFIGDEQGFIPAFGVYVVRNQSDFINRLQFEFVKEMDDYGIIGTLGVMSFLSIWFYIERILFYKTIDIKSYEFKEELEIDLTNNTTIISSFASNSVYIGLLGTVFGIILTFYSMGQSGQIDVKIIMSSLGLALKATAMGLIVAIPAMMFYNHLARKIEVKLALWDINNK